MRRLTRILGWSPVGKQPWYFHWFRLLYTVPMVIILLGWADDTVVFDKHVTDDDVQVIREPDWNAPLRFSDGRCLVIETREYVEC